MSQSLRQELNFSDETGRAMELAKRYNPEKVEGKWYRFWEKEGFFHSDVDKTKESFSIVIPPPNVTGALHMGHGLNNTIQDILIRWRRMQGLNALWVPGTDHAGIATQNVVERQIAAKGKTRQEIGRERFIELVWKWREQYGGRIIDQLKRLGASCDWERERFTMDGGLSRAVREVFVQLYDEKLIYRGKYIINWCPRCQTALSDEEVEHETQKGFLYYIKYPLKGNGGYIVVATTRPETMLGDTAVAVNPDDERYRKYIGKTVILPLVERKLPVIADSYVDPEFGTGALKITPAHDPNDFEIGVRHNLSSVNIFNEDATINENGIPDCVGMDRYEAREVVLEALKKGSYYLKQEQYSHEVGHCYRCHTVIEPYLSEQWFVKMKPLAEDAIRAVKEGRVRFYPRRWEKVYMNWMNNIKDWCISRQIWWGHRIPVYYCRECGEMFASVDEPDGCRSCSSRNIVQDEDVLDTWFSSQLWPFSTLGWPERTEELGYYYPTAVLVTDPGILFFWVARMIMSGLKFMEDVPFRDVYIHGVVMDAEGRKMSKSLGNGIDPLEVVERYGADAMRHTIVNITPFGQNLLLSMDKFNAGARFANKIWNASRYILMNIEGIEFRDVEDRDLDTPDRWILTLFERVKRDMNRFLGKYRLSDASSLVYEFFWHEFCDWYIEISKLKLYSDDPSKRSHAASMLLRILDGCLRLLHPIMPFITEEIWQRLPLKREIKSIMIASYPVYEEAHVYAESIQPIEVLKELTYNIRNIRGELRVPPEMKADILVKTTDEMVRRVLEELGEVIRFLARLKRIEIGGDLAKPPGCASSVGSGYEVYLPLVGLIDIDKERSRLQKELERLTGEIERSDRKLNKSEFITKAPQSIVERERERLESHREARERVNGILESLN
jgi:valyl-tRNA synthetase